MFTLVQISFSIKNGNQMFLSTLKDWLLDISPYPIIMSEEIESYQTSKGNVTMSIEIHILQKLTKCQRES
jgi:hypothetical protein